MPTHKSAASTKKYSPVMRKAEETRRIRKAKRRAARVHRMVIGSASPKNQLWSAVLKPIINSYRAMASPSHKIEP